MQTPEESLDGLKSRWKNFDFNALKVHSANEEHLSLDFLGRIKFFASSTKKINDAVMASGSLIDTVGKSVSGVPLGVLKATPIIDLALTSFDFIRIPMLYMACKMMGEKVPFKLSNNAKWAFGGVLLGLGLTGLFVPVAAPFIAIVIPSLLFISSAVTFKMLCNQRQKDSIMSLALEQEIPKEAAALKAIIEKMSDDSSIQQLSVLAEQQESKLKALYRKKNTLKASQDNLKILDGTVGVVVYGLLALGATLSVLAISAAPFIAIAGGLLSGGYLLGRGITSTLSAFLRKKSTKDETSKSSDDDIPYVPKDETSEVMPYDALLPDSAPASVLAEKSTLKSVSREIHLHETHDVVESLGENNANRGPRMGL